MSWIIPAGVIAAVVAAAIGYRKFLERRYEDIYGAEGPSYEDPPVMPNLPTSGPIG